MNTQISHNFTNTWKFQTPRALGWRFSIVYIIFIILFSAYAVGVVFLLNSKFETPAMRNSFSFGDSITLVWSVILATWAMNAIEGQKRRFRLTQKLIKTGKHAMQTFVAAYSTKLTDSKILQAKSAIEMSVVLIIWQMSVDIATPESAKRIMLKLPRNSYVEVIDALQSNDVWGIRLLALVIDAINGAQLPTATSTFIVGALADLRREMDNVAISYSTDSWWIVGVMMKFSFCIYILAIPPITWPSQGWFLIASSCFFYVSVGGVFVYAWMLGDILKNPVDVFAGILFAETSDFLHYYENISALYMSRTTGKQPQLLNTMSPNLYVAFFPP